MSLRDHRSRLESGRGAGSSHGRDPQCQDWSPRDPLDSALDHLLAMHSSRMFDRGLGRVIGLRRWDDGRDPSAELRSDQPHGCRKRKGPVSVRTLTTNAGAEVYTTVYTYESMNLHACIHTYYLACAPYPLSPKGLEPPSHLWVGGWLHVAFRRISSCCGRGCFGFNSPPSPSRSLWVGVCVSVYIYIYVYSCLVLLVGGWVGFGFAQSSSPRGCGSCGRGSRP